MTYLFRHPLRFVRTIAGAALWQSLYGGKDGRVMAHPEGFR
jgi:hypothetical protein